MGSALVGILQDRADAMAVQSGARLEFAGIAVHDLSRTRAAHIPLDLLTADPARLVSDPSIDVVVELIGGVTPAGALVRKALEAGKPVVTANKELLAAPEGVELRALANQQGVDLLYEAAVAGAIPLVRALRESLAGERIHRVMGIVNGTTNFILTKMSEQGAAYADALAEAQALGLAERDPDRRRRGIRRRRQGRHPGRRGLRLRRRRCRRHPGGHHRRQAGRHRLRRPARLCRQAAGHRRAHR